MDGLQGQITKDQLKKKQIKGWKVAKVKLIDTSFGSAAPVNVKEMRGWQPSSAAPSFLDIGYRSSLKWLPGVKHFC